MNGLFKSMNLPLSSPLEHRNKGVNNTGLISSISVQDLRRIEKFYSDDYAQFGYEIDLLRPLPLVQYWNTSDPPNPVDTRMKSCKILNSGWDYLQFNQQTAASFLECVYGSHIAAAFLDIRLPAMQADVFRVGFLLHCGGLWVDAATSLMQSVDSWIDRQFSFQMIRRSHQAHPKIATQVIYASRPGLPLLKAAWDEMVPRLLSRSGTKVYRDFGPGLFRDLMASRPNLALGLHAVPEVLLQSVLKFDSSSNILSPEQHWSKRQEVESLYLSGE